MTGHITGEVAGLRFRKEAIGGVRRNGDNTCHAGEAEEASPCWCSGAVEHLPNGTCPTREYWLAIEDSE